MHGSRYKSISTPLLPLSPSTTFLACLLTIRLPTFAFEGEDLIVKARSVQKTWFNCLASHRYFCALFVDVTFALEAHLWHSPPTFTSAGLNGATASDG